MTLNGEYLADPAHNKKQHDKNATLAKLALAHHDDHDTQLVCTILRHVSLAQVALNGDRDGSLQML